MSMSPQKRIEISLEKLNTLRSKICQAYSKRKGGEELQTPNNKGSIYYSNLRDEINFKTKKKISEGTLLKFFHDDNNRNYQLYTIDAIEEYIDKSLSEQITINNKNKENIEREIKIFAKRIYIELSTRKAGIPINEEKDVIEDIYNSWYKLFCIIRDELKALPAVCLKDRKIPGSAVYISFDILDNILRIHLTEYNAIYRSWLEKAKQNPSYKNLTPQELQKKYPDYNALIKSLKETNKRLINSAERLFEFINQEK